MQLFVPYFGVVESVPCYENQHCDEQQFQTLSCVHYTIFSVVKLDLFIRGLLLDRILALEKTTRTSCYLLWINLRLGILPSSHLRDGGENVPSEDFAFQIRGGGGKPLEVFTPRHAPDLYICL